MSPNDRKKTDVAVVTQRLMEGRKWVGDSFVCTVTEREGEGVKLGLIPARFRINEKQNDIKVSFRSSFHSVFVSACFYMSVYAARTR